MSESVFGGNTGAFWLAIAAFVGLGIFIVMLLINISRRHRAEAALRESENHLQTILDGVGAAIHLKDTEGRYIRVNRKFAKIFGISMEQAKGRTAADIFPKKEADICIGDDRRAWATGKAVTNEIVVRTAEGRRTLYTVKVPLIDAAGKPYALCGISTDITERTLAEEALRESEERYRKLVEQSPDALLVHRDWKVLFANPAAARLLGAGDPGEMIGLSVKDFIHPDFHEIAESRCRSLNLEKQSLPPIEIQWLRLDGQLIEMEAMATLITIEGKPAIQSALHDVTKRKRMEQELAQTQKMKAIGQLTGGVAHDFNNILQVILGNLNLLEENIDDDESSRLIENAIDAGRHGAKLTRHLLAFSRRQTLKPEATDINQLVAGMIQLLTRTLGEDISIATSLAADMGKINIDRNALENAILNLALNARAAMPEGGTLTATTDAIRLDKGISVASGDLPAGSYALLTISDTGTGMDPEVLERVFEPFFTTKGVGEGSGLGLSMVYGFANQSGGHVAIESEPGKGTSVMMYLPVIDEPPGGHPRHGTERQPEPSPSGTILVVEDDPAVRDITVKNLIRLGYRVLEAANGPMALAVLADRDDIDLLFTDIVMPGGMSGIDLAREAVDLCQGLKVLLTSGYPNGNFELKGSPGDRVGLLGKPYSRDKLAASVRDALEG